MKTLHKRRLAQAIALLVSTVISSLHHPPPIKAAQTKRSPSAKTRRHDSLPMSEPTAGDPPRLKRPSGGLSVAPPGPARSGFPFQMVGTQRPAPRQFGWKTGIVTTTFWVGEAPAQNNPVPNRKSCWDPAWQKNYGGYDHPDRRHRRGYIPVAFIPRQNPFYVALPYNDMSHGVPKSEAARVIPWFADQPNGPGRSVLKGRWIAVRFQGRTCYAQWEDAGPFRTDHWQYVFGNERPAPNLNRGAGLDVSPAVRDFLKMSPTDVTDWRFVEFSDVPVGPWAALGENNPFVQRRRGGATGLLASADGNGPIAPTP